MNDCSDLIRKCCDLKIMLTPDGNKLKMKGTSPMPDELRTALIEYKGAVIAELRHQRQIEVEGWICEEWRKINLPAWRRILKESIAVNDLARELYARKMLKDVLFDPDYKQEDK